MPRPGMFATVRNRWGVIAAVAPPRPLLGESAYRQLFDDLHSGRPPDASPIATERPQPYSAKVHQGVPFD